MQTRLPGTLITSLQNTKGFDEAAFLLAHEVQQQVTSVRFNPNKPALLKHNTDLPFEDAVPWCKDAFYLQARPQFVFDPLWHAGVYYVQEASSMFLWHVLKQLMKETANMKVLDLCAAPGGKSTLLASYFKDGFVVCNEVIKSRVAVLNENMIKWGAANIAVTNNDPKDFASLKNYFDVLVIDAPCSGSGLFRKDIDAVEEWSEANVALCSQRQKRIITDSYDALKQDGYLIYSTCSYSKEEDEEILDWLVTNFELESVQIQIDESWNIIEVQSDKNYAFCYRFYPYAVRGEGFFIAAFRKKDGDEFNGYNITKPLPVLKEAAVFKEWLNNDMALRFLKQGENFIAVPETLMQDVMMLQKKLYLRKAGVTIGETKGKDFIPNHQLAVSFLLNENVQTISIDKEDALQYLRKQEVMFDESLKSWTLVQYNGVNLGWIKVLQHRVNNYYPTEWRILKH